jgi:hypothetical protein
MKTFKKLREDGALGPGPSNAISTGAIAGSGEKGGEPGVNLKKKKSVVMAPTFTRKSPKM